MARKPKAPKPLTDPIICLADTASAFDLNTEDGRSRARVAEAYSEEMRRHMSAPGKLRIPPLLDKRRQMLGIPDGAFKVEAMFDRIFIWQIPWGDGVRAKNSLIQLTDVGKAIEQESAPRGMIVSAGLSALDSLRSNGLDIGHIVTFTRLAPLRIPCETISGKSQYLVVINAGDIAGAEDLALALRQGITKTVAKRYKRQGVEVVEHVHQDKSGKTWVPELPWRSAEY